MPIPLPDDMLDKVHDLTLACLSGEASPDEVAQLNELLRNDKTARRIYAYAILDSSRLRRWAAATSLHSTEAFDGGEADATLLMSGLFDAETDIDVPFDRADEKEHRDAAPLPFLGNVIHGPLGYFSSDCPVAYLVATVILAIGLLIGSFVHVSSPVQVVRQDSPAPFSPLPASSQFVGRITGMVDCQWARNLPSPAFGRGAGGEGSLQLQSPVHLHDCFALSSGLMEITYDTGAKIILQGPVTYEVESVAGGYLSVGKLTANVEKAGDRGEDSDSALRLPPSALFSVRTPTAIVTDLGTEFGVEVSNDGATMSHVFRGSVEVQATAPSGDSTIPPRVLKANESVVVQKTDGGNPVVSLNTSAQPVEFVRTLPKTTRKTLDLADVVAGGDGFSGRRGRGIDPATGQPTVSTLAEAKNANTLDLSRFRVVSDGEYHRAETLPFVDGVFIPDGRSGGVQVDSAGHVFSEFHTACNTTAGNIWAGGIVPVLSSSMPPDVAALLSPLSPSETLMPTNLGAIDYASKSHALIFLPANIGITFDLDAIRQANPSFNLVRFRATAGNMEIASENRLAEASADFWVLVDSHMRFRRREINKFSGVFQIVFPIAKEDRFLTLVATDGGNDIGFDWILFGDPLLELSPAAPAMQSNQPSK